MLLVYMNTVIFMDYGQKSFNILITIDFLTLKNVLSKPILFLGEMAFLISNNNLFKFSSK